MKKLLLGITALLLVIGATAQQVSMDMETWVQAGVSSFKNPQGWVSFNASVGGLSVASQTVFKDSTDFFQGLASAKIVTSNVQSGFFNVPNPYRPGHNYDTMGIMVLGSYASGAFRYGQQMPTPWRAPFLSFASKYTPAGADSAYVIAYLTKHNGAVRDTIATGIYRTGASTTTYSINNITMVYNPTYIGVIPDTEMIYCSSSRYKTKGSKVGSAFYVDAFQWTGFTGINEINTGNTTSVFPNPATSEINFTSSINANYIEVMDITGRKLGLFLMQNNKVKVQTETFRTGLYLYDVLNEKKEIISRGKFEIAK